MLRSEFDTLSKATRRPTDDEYNLIEFVYNWHPLNFSKENVAAFYDAYGMTIFYDMEQRSKMAMERDVIVRRYEEQIKRLQDLKAEVIENKLDGRLGSND